ncbi:Sodium:dicarboxylate symporter family protein [Caprobacter fermentans]|uniref:Sodium:dicarboxylate symporter family protein n=1 Tax=Caproicibacter fermentans TaxID=2576756 RepID=A0A6N8HVQ5_9FIRM|nr:dicarboxylate/amino acid:cation symporter [Caproicibacter fermentans]MVB09637.1 Sodium:dicarboxylate symporter family protein [Caproicibacter fermentans]
MKRLLSSLPFKLLLGVALGVAVGLIANEAFMNFVVTVKYVLSEVINFCVPLIIIGFIAPSITKLGSNASRMLAVAVVIAYASSIGAALMSMGAGFGIIPTMDISSRAEDLKSLPKVIFQLSIPQVMPVMSALVLSIFLGLAAVWTKAETTIRLLDEFQNIVLQIVTKIVIPILPYFIAATFCTLAYEGSITKQIPIFLEVIIIVMIGHYIWLTLLYAVSGAYSKQNSFKVIKYYGPAYLTALGTMSSAATLAVSLKCAHKSPVLRSDMVDFGIPLFANIHLCGSVLTEVFFVMTISKVLYGKLPTLGSMVLFCLLLGVFALGAPGVPGGTVMASLGLITGVLGFDATGTALMVTIFALQDSFGTACNVTGDGALTLILTAYADRHIRDEIQHPVFNDSLSRS